MQEILFIKTSSLGDVVHNMPAVCEARRHLPHARIRWLVEEGYAPLVRLHPAVDEVIPVAVRRWRRAVFARATWSELGRAIRQLRDREHDAIVDTQGLLRTGVMARFARGQRHGYDSASIREPLASLFYDMRHAVSRELHAIERNRRLAGEVLGYTPEGGPDYGLSAAPRRADGYAVLLHGSARPEKEWPSESWVAVAEAVRAGGLRVVLPWGTPRERDRSHALARQIDGAEVPQRQPLDAVAHLLARATLVVGLDTGLLHLAAALGVPLVGLFIASDPALTGPRGPGPIAIVGGKDAGPATGDVIAAIEGVLAPRSGSASAAG